MTVAVAELIADPTAAAAFSSMQKLIRFGRSMSDFSSEMAMLLSSSSSSSSSSFLTSGWLALPVPAAVISGPTM